MTEIYHLLSYLEDVRERQSTKYVKAFSARCPAHDDRSPSLSVALTHDDKILIYCHAGCGANAVLSALGLEMHDLFPDADRHKPPGYQKPLYSQRDYEEALQTGETAQNYIKINRKPKASDLPFIEKSLKALLYLRGQIKEEQSEEVR